MTTEDLEQALRAMARRRPLRPYFLEFISGDRILVAHPEAIYRQGEFFLYRGPEGGQRVFIEPSVCQFIAPPSPPPPG
jgi:hypothetical protein